MSPSQSWTPSRIYNLYRITIATVLLTLFYVSEQRLIGQYMPALFEGTVSGYLLLTLVSSAMDYSERLRKPGFAQPLALVIDVLVLGLVVHANGGLEGRDYVADDYSIADIAIFPWTRSYKRQNVVIEDYPNVVAWRKRMIERPAVAKGMQAGAEFNADLRELSPEEWKRLFGA